MNFEEDNYDKFNKEDINNLNKLNFDFVLNDRFIHVKDQNGNYFECQTPFLKVLKPIHTTLNKKKTIAKKYVILEINDELDFNNQIGEFMFIINKIHETCQEKIKEKSLQWFNTEFDEIGLDIKVRRPFDQQKDNEFIRISIPKNFEMEDEISKLKGSYILCNIIFKGLKISNDYIMEEWEIKDFISQEKYDQLQNKEYINDTIIEEKIDTIEDLIDSNLIEEEILVKDNIIESIVEDILVKDNVIENILVKDIVIENILPKDNLTEDKLDVNNNIIENNVKKNKKIKTVKDVIKPIKKSSKKLIFT
jgi:hypothetical protein